MGGPQLTSIWGQGCTVGTKVLPPPPKQAFWDIDLKLVMKRKAQNAPWFEPPPYLLQVTQLDSWHGHLSAWELGVAGRSTSIKAKPACWPFPWVPLFPGAPAGTGLLCVCTWGGPVFLLKCRAPPPSPVCRTVPGLACPVPPGVSHSYRTPVVVCNTPRTFLLLL